MKEKKKTCIGQEKMLFSFCFYLKSRKEVLREKLGYPYWYSGAHLILQCRYKVDRKFCSSQYCRQRKAFFITTLDYLIRRIACGFSSNVDLWEVAQLACICVMCLKIVVYRFPPPPLFGFLFVCFLVQKCHILGTFISN